MLTLPSKMPKPVPTVHVPFDWPPITGSFSSLKLWVVALLPSNVTSGIDVAAATPRTRRRGSLANMAEEWVEVEGRLTSAGSKVDEQASVQVLVSRCAE